jgi:hypothetical protein
LPGYLPTRCSFSLPDTNRLSLSPYPSFVLSLSALLLSFLTLSRFDPHPQVSEAFSKSDPIPPGLNSQTSILAFYGTCRFITLFTRARHRLLSGTKRILPSLSHSIFLKFVLIVSSHVRFSPHASYTPRPSYPS